MTHGKQDTHDNEKNKHNEIREEPTVKFHKNPCFLFSVCIITQEPAVPQEKNKTPPEKPNVIKLRELDLTGMWDPVFCNNFGNNT